jgi:MFS family permease
VALAIANGTRQGYGVFLPALIKELGESNAKLAGAFSIIHLFNGFFAPLVGRSIDVYSPRLIFLTGTLLVSTAFGLLGMVKELWHIYVIIILVMAPGISCIGLTAVNTLISRSFDERRGSALGFVAMGSGVGTFVFLFISSILIDWFGWQKTFWFWGAVQLIILLPMIMKFLNKPEDGLELGQSEKSETFRLNAVIPWRSQNIILIFCSVLLFTMANFIYLMYFVAYAKSEGILYVYASQALSIVGISNVVGSFSLASLSDLFTNRSKALVTSIGFVTFALFLLTFIPVSYALIVFSSFIFGVGMGGYYPILPALIGELFGQKHIGAIYGSTLLIGGVGAFIGPVIGGLLYDITGEYYFTVGTALIFALVAFSTAILLARKNPQYEEG